MRVQSRLEQPAASRLQRGTHKGRYACVFLATDRGLEPTRWFLYIDQSEQFERGLQVDSGATPRVLFIYKAASGTSAPQPPLSTPYSTYFQACVRRRSVLSVAANPACPDTETAERAVNEVWDSCFQDTRPFDEVSLPRRTGA